MTNRISIDSDRALQIIKKWKDAALESLVAEAWSGRRRDELTALEDVIFTRLLDGGYMRIRNGVIFQYPAESRRCSFREAVPWPGHGMAVLKYKHCKNKTHHPSGKCHHHR